MKIQFITVLTILSLLISCQNKISKTEAVNRVKSCCADSTKSCCSKSTKKVSAADSSSISMVGVHVVYFHNQRRCATCMAVEEGAAEVVKQFADSSITFHSYLIGHPLSSSIEKKFDIDGQTLLIIGKGKLIDVTNMAFLNAMVNPDIYKEELKKQIEKLK
jgi:hypothetical protein